jgi:hypothetical protein
MIILLFLIVSAHAVVPTYKTVQTTVNSNVTLPCTSSTNVVWIYYNESIPAEMDIVIGDIVKRELQTRYIVTPAGNNSHNLLVSHASPSDSGMYFCVEELGGGRKHHVYLIVKENITCRVPAVTDVTTTTVTNKSSNGNVMVTTFVALFVTTVVFLCILVIYICTLRNHYRKQSTNDYKCYLTNETTRQDSNHLLHSTDDRMTDVKKILGPERDICLFAEMSGVLYVVYSNGIIKSYRIGDYLTSNSEIKIPASNFEQGGFVADAKHNCLYLGNKCDQCIYKVNPDTENVTVALVLKKFEFPQSLACISDGRVAVLIGKNASFGKAYEREIILLSHS